MKRLTATLLVLAMMVSLVVPGLSIAVSAEGSSVEAGWTDSAPTFDKASGRF